MSRFIECSSYYMVPLLADWNRDLERPLSILLANAQEIEQLVEWEPWVRRVAIFAHSNTTYYHLVASASGLDFFTRFNFKLRVGDLPEISSSEEITWPFDVISITLDEETWGSGMNEQMVWADFLSKQVGSAENFLLITQGPVKCVYEVEKLLKLVEREMHQPFNLTKLQFTTFRSDDIQLACCIWNVGNQPTRKKLQITLEEEDAITEIMLWGDET